MSWLVELPRCSVSGPEIESVPNPVTYAPVQMPVPRRLVLEIVAWSLGSTQGTETIKFIEFKFNLNVEFVVGLMLIKDLVNTLTPNEPYRGRTTPVTSKVAFYIFIQQI